MHPDFWHQRWQTKQIGFHLPEANPLLVEYFSALQLAPQSRVFLPLCGKTLDIAWLLAQGFQVAGAELSTIAVEGLFKSLNLTPSITPLGEIAHYQAENLDIFVGDIFKLSQKHLGKVDAVYDRAALVALPEEMRNLYAKHLMTLTNLAAQLLVCFEYDQTLHAGPPFSIRAEEVQQHYADYFDVYLLATVDVVGGLKGKCAATELVWCLQQKNEI
jgi:thiopurine S-methyltransferase